MDVGVGVVVVVPGGFAGDGDCDIWTVDSIDILDVSGVEGVCCCCCCCCRGVPGGAGEPPRLRGESGCGSLA